MPAFDLDTLARSILERAAACGFAVAGPAETEYGFGWEPTITFWAGQRRVHFYHNISLGFGGYVVEVAECDGHDPAQRGVVRTIDAAWTVVDLFLRARRPLDDLPHLGWVVDGLDHDKSIPHPPDDSNPSNIAQLVKRMRGDAGRRDS